MRTPKHYEVTINREGDGARVTYAPPLATTTVARGQVPDDLPGYVRRALSNYWKITEVQR